MLSVKSVKGKGRGIFAQKAYSTGDIIEICPVLLFNIPKGQDHLYEEYAFRWTTRKVAIALGYGSLYNHSYTPNALYQRKIKEKTIHVIAYKDIKIGDEICFNYNGNPDSQAPLWFKVR